MHRLKDSFADFVIHVRNFNSVDNVELPKQNYPNSKEDLDNQSIEELNPVSYQEVREVSCIQQVCDNLCFSLNTN